MPTLAGGGTRPDTIDPDTHGSDGPRSVISTR